VDGAVTGLKRRGLLATGAALLASPVTARAQDVAAVQAPIRNLYSALEAEMQGTAVRPFRERFDSLAPVIDHVFDLDTILRVSVGPRWVSLDEKARSALAEAFRRFTIATYVAHFDTYEREKFEVLPQVRDSGTGRIVETRIVQSNGEPVRLDYLLHNGQAGWQVVDVLMDGAISRVAVQRSDFRAMLAKGGAPALIDSLRKKTVDLSGGTLAS
jgi:phospholipid transport system substrate-binding protein